MESNTNTTTSIPIKIGEEDFNEFFLPHLSMPKRGPKCKISYHKIFNYILKVLYTGIQWKELPIDKNTETRLPEIHYSNVYKHFAKWQIDGSWEAAFNSSVKVLAEEDKLDFSVLHGDASNTVAKKGGDGIGYSGHKHQKGEKTMAIVDNNGNMLSPMIVASVNQNDTTLLPKSLIHLNNLTKSLGLELKGTVFNLDAGFDSLINRKYIFNRQMTPNIKENQRNRKQTKKGRKRLFDQQIYNLRYCVERTFAWEDKFKRLLIRFETIQVRHQAFKFLAYALINLRTSLAF
jgi:transposase